MCVCIRSNTRLRVTTASGMNLFNLIRFEKYGGGGSIPASDREFEFHASTVVEKQQGGRGGWRTRLKGRLKGARRRERERPPPRGTDSLDSSAGVKSKRRASSRARDTRGTRDRDGKGKKERGRGGGGG